MGQADTIDVDTDAKSTVSTLSQARLDQLAKAREVSLRKRRTHMKDRLEAKLTELRFLLGNDLRPVTMERIADQMLKKEEHLRINKALRLTIKRLSLI